MSDHLKLWFPWRVFLVILSDAALHDWPKVADQPLWKNKSTLKCKLVLVRFHAVFQAAVLCIGLGQ